MTWATCGEGRHGTRAVCPTFCRRVKNLSYFGQTLSTHATVIFLYEELSSLRSPIQGIEGQRDRGAKGRNNSGPSTP